MTPRRLPASALVLAAALAASAADPVRVEKVEALEGEQTVVKVTLSAPLAEAPRATLLPKSGAQPERLAVDLPGATLKNNRSREAKVGWGGVKTMRLGVADEQSVRLVLDLTEPMRFDVTTDGPAVNVTLVPARAPAPANDAPIELRTVDPPAK